MQFDLLPKVMEYDKIVQKIVKHPVPVLTVTMNISKQIASMLS